MDPASVYIPIDRRLALARGEELPERTTGAALFADISGFTPLTEALALELGPRRGAEELTVHLNNVYNALIAELHRYGGSVIGFSGDAITCWLDGDDGRRAMAAGLAMQQAMQQFREIKTYMGRVISLGMKVAIAVGPVRRFVVGDPAHVLWDVLAGRTVARMAEGEHLAERGEVLVDEAAATALGYGTADTAPGVALHISEWRTADEGMRDRGYRFAVVTGLDLDVPEQPWPELQADTLPKATTAGWVLPPVYRRLQSGLGEFLAELRSTVSLFMRFSGIDYDDDPTAPQKLDAFIREVERILDRHDGSLLQVTVGDKGSYLYGGFGAPVAHEDDAARAASTALALHELVASLPYLNQAQIGITVGRTRTGAYGSTTRRTYGVLGDVVNLSARLMAAAAPGQILVSDQARASTGDLFSWERLPAVQVKGKLELVPISRLLGLKKARSTGLLEPEYSLPMVGRAQELALIREKVQAVLRGRGQIIGVTAEAGMGKSRLTAEAVRVARAEGLTGFGGECQSYGTTTSYLVWQGVWRGFFDLDPALSAEGQIATLEEHLRRMDPTLLPRLPLLGAVLNLAIPDNELTRSLDAKVRKSSLEELLVRCLRARSQLEPLMLVLEDCHWLDDLSRELIGVIGRSIADLPVLMLLVYRPPDRLREQAPPVEELPYFSEIELKEFSADETRQLVAMKLAQVVGEETDTRPAAAAAAAVAGRVPLALLERVSTQAAGNPFYIEELLNYLQDLQIDLRNEGALEAVELPASINALVLSRIDQLDESQQLTIKVASVIGRLFRAAMIWGIYPDLTVERVQGNLDRLSRLDLTPVDTPDPDLTYLFKHVITQQVAYESLLYSARATLHEQIGLFMERTYPESLDRQVNLLAFHYEHSENQAKKLEYLLKAGEAAQRDYALAAARKYFEKSLPLLAGRARVDTRLKLGHVYELSGAWEEADDQYNTALSEAQALGDREAVAWCQTALGELSRKRNQYETAASWLAEAQKTFEALNDVAGLAQVLHYAGSVATQQGDCDLANELYHTSLALRRELGDRENEASVLSNLGIVARALGDRDAARRYYQASLAIREEIGNRWAIAVSLNNLGNAALDRGDYSEARDLFERALVNWREIGERWATTNTIHNLANVAREEGHDEEARRLYAECMAGWQELNDRLGMAYWLEDMGLLQARQGAGKQALQLTSAAEALREQIGAPRPPAYQARLDAALAPAREALGDEAAALAREAGRALSLDEAIELALAPDGR